MTHIKAIGFDLFNTLITVEPPALDEAVTRLVLSLRKNDLILDEESFIRSYREAAIRFIEGTRRDWRETHNRFWIRAALKGQGYDVEPDDSRIAAAVDAYFSAFMDRCSLIPGTTEMLGILRGPYRLGLLSNFTHPPAAMEIINGLGLTPFFDAVLISGELGFRKPHPLVFCRLIEELGVTKEQILYVGDDPEPDIIGATRAGLHPVWFTYVRDNHIPTPSTISLGSPKDPGMGTTRISSWKELLSLLDSAHPEIPIS
jgi:putative hydrolase of the HAD superfamily